MKSITLSSKIGARRLASASRIVAVEIPHLLLAAGHLAGAIHHGAAQLLVGHLDAVALADLGDHQTEPHAPLGDAAVFFLGLFLGGALFLEGALAGLQVVLESSSRRW